jgi:hypothetical protein
MTLFEFLTAFEQALAAEDRGQNNKRVVQLQANGHQPFLKVVTPDDVTHSLGALQCVPQGKAEKVQNLIVNDKAPYGLINTALRVLAG